MHIMRLKHGKYIFLMCFIIISLIIKPSPSFAYQLINQEYQEVSYDNVLTLKQLSIQLLPEYENPQNWGKDQPSLLVSYVGEFVNDTNDEFADYIYLPVPAGSTMFICSMVCETEKGISYLEYEIHDQYVRWKPSKPIQAYETYPFVVEYYCNPFQVDDKGNKKFSFTFVPDESIDKIDVDIYLPPKSNAHLLFPEYQEHQVINNGTHVYSYLYRNISELYPLELSVEYNKMDHTPTMYLEGGEFYSFENEINLDTLGIVVFTLILLIIGASVIVLSTNNKRNKANAAKYETDFADEIFDDDESRREGLRKLLLKGKINEQTYQSLLDEEQKQDE